MWWVRLVGGCAFVCVLALAGSACSTDGDPATDAAVADTAGDVADVPASSATLVHDPERLDFGLWPVGASEVRDLELEAAGGDPIVITGVVVVPETGVFAPNRTQLEIPAGGTAVLKITFFGLTAGAHEATLRLETNAANGPVVEVPLTATATDADCLDADGDLHGVGCPAGGDCDERDPNVYVGAPERCNARDDDCDSLFDEDFVGLGATCFSGLGACANAGVNVCSDDGERVICDADADPGAVERCNDLDDDCDGATDEDFPSKGGPCAVGHGACRVVDKWVCAVDGSELVCPVSARPEHVEVCSDGVDNDCDGVTDEGTIEVCGDDVDNDCDGVTDESGSRWGEAFFARDWHDETVAIYPSVGDGTFEAPIVLDLPGNNRFSVLGVGDFDGDRWLDLAVQEIVTDGRTACVRAADCGAGFTCADRVCRKSCASNADCTVFPFEECVDTQPDNTTNPKHCLPPSRVHVAVSSCTGDDAITLTQLFVLDPGDVIGTVVDVDGNGHLDFVGLRYFAKAKQGFLWLSDGVGGFTHAPDAFDYGALFGTHPFISRPAWGLTRNTKDLDGDGWVDILGQGQLSAAQLTTGLWVAWNLGGGQFSAMTQLGPTLPGPANLTAVDDFDGDGDHDVIGGLDEDGQPGAAWLLSSLGGAWAPPYEVFDLAPGYDAGLEKPGHGDGTSWDFDGDDRSDVLVAWTPEECGAFVEGCAEITDQAHPCYGGDCRKVGFIRNVTRSPCASGTSCVDGACVAGCTASCVDRECGDDGCGGECGRCEDGQRCLAGQCAVDCAPDCDGRQCGDNGCGGSCGACPEGSSCAFGACSDDCVPDCTGKACGGDGCGGTCAIFAAPAIIAYDQNPATRLAAPINVPPTRPSVAIDPPNPGPNADLGCVIVTPSYDLDAVRYERRWFRDGVFQKALGDRERVDDLLTAAGETWRCEVRASDGVERSPMAEATATISP